MHYQATIKYHDQTTQSSSLYPTDGQAVASLLHPHVAPDAKLIVIRITGSDIEVAYTTTVAQYIEETL